MPAPAAHERRHAKCPSAGVAVCSLGQRWKARCRGLGRQGRACFGAKATEERRKLKALGRRLKHQSQINRTEELCFYRYPYSNRTDSHTGRPF